MSGISNHGSHGTHGQHHHHHHGNHDAAAQKGGKCDSSEGGQSDPAQMFQQILQQLMQGQGQG